MSEEKEVLKLILQKLTKLEEGQANLEEGQAELKLEVNIIKGQLEENTAILRALEHKTDVHKAEMDNLEGIVKEIRDDQKSFFEIIGEHDVSIRTLRRRA